MESEDRFCEVFFSRIPAEVAGTFTSGQLTAVKTAFGARISAAHSVEIRRMFSLLGRRYYFVLLAGSDRRSRGRSIAETIARPLWTAANIFLLLAVLVAVVMALLGFLYAAKMALGLDLVPGVDMLPDETIKKWLWD